MFRLENNASLFSVRKNKKSKDLKKPAQKHLTFVSRFFVEKLLIKCRMILICIWISTGYNKIINAVKGVY